MISNLALSHSSPSSSKVMGSDELQKEGRPVLQTKRLLVRIVDYLAAEKPQLLYAEFPRSPTTYADGFQSVTYGAFADAINGIAWWLHDTLGLGKNFETLAYIGPNDLRYPALILGANKAGHKVSECSFEPSRSIR